MTSSVIVKGKGKHTRGSRVSRQQLPSTQCGSQTVFGGLLSHRITARVLVIPCAPPTYVLALLTCSRSPATPAAAQDSTRLGEERASLILRTSRSRPQHVNPFVAATHATRNRNPGPHPKCVASAPTWTPKRGDVPFKGRYAVCTCAE